MADEALQSLLDGAPLVDGDALTLVGGVVDEGDVPALVRWLETLGGDSWWTFRELTDEMRLGEGLDPLDGDLGRLVWARWFGPAGDLEARRDGGRFWWRWVGEKGTRPPEDVAKVETDFFAARAGKPGRVLRRASEATALLWDARDARVATADPKETLAILPKDGTRMRLRYQPYFDHGVVAAVRYLKIEQVSGVVPEAVNPSEAAG